MGKADNHIDELGKIIERIFIRGINYHAIQGLDFNRSDELIQAMQADSRQKLDQYYADFYRKKIPEKMKYPVSVFGKAHVDGYNQAIDDVRNKLRGE